MAHRVIPKYLEQIKNTNLRERFSKIILYFSDLMQISVICNWLLYAVFPLNYFTYIKNESALLIIIWYILFFSSELTMTSKVIIDLVLFLKGHCLDWH